MVAERVAREATVVEEMAVASVAEGALAVATEVAVAAEGRQAAEGSGWLAGGRVVGSRAVVCLAVLEEGTARVEALLVAEVGPRVEEVPWAGDSGGDGEGGA